MSGTTIGPYRVLCLVKQGGGGSVYTALDERLKRRVALKFIELTQQREERRQFIAEARNLAAVNHPLIVQIFDVVELRNHIVLVMEYVPGADLADLASAIELDLGSVLQIGMDLSAALAAVHNMGIVHGDIKPDNVLLDLSGRARLTDFGIAQGPASALDSGVVSGSLIALAPEQLAGVSANTSSDLFALGILLYSLIARCHPFGDHGDEQAFLARLAQASPPSLKSLADPIPVRLKVLLTSLLAKEPDQRPVSVLWVRQELAILRRDLPIGRVDVLAQQVLNAAHLEDTVPMVSELPPGVFGGARSHLLSQLQWRPRVRSAEQHWRRLAVLAIVCVLALAFFIWQREHVEPDMVHVSLARPELMLVDGAKEAITADDLAHMLRRSVAGHPRLVHRSGPAPDLLTVQVRCNPHVCSMLIRHQTRGSNPRIDYSTLLAQAPIAVWEATLTMGLASLFDV